MKPHLEPIPPPAAVDRETNVSTSDRKTEDDELHEEPEPAAAGALLGSRCTPVFVAVVVLLGGGAGAGLAGGRVEVLGLDADDVVAVAELAGLSAESEVADGGELDVRDREAAGPLVLVLVHQVQGELFVLEVGDLGAGREVRVTHATGRAAGELVCLTVVALVVLGLAVADHGHDVGEDDAGTVVLVGVEEDAQALELVPHAEYRSFLHAGLCNPESHAITKESAGAMDLEFELDFPVGCRKRNAGE